jgi:hypothetical protein
MEENFNQIEPPEELLNKVFSRLKHEQKKAVIKKIAFFSVGILSSVFVFIPMLIGTIAEIQQSGFAYIVSLLFSDFRAVVSIWDDFLLSVLETLPIIHFAILFASVYVFLRSIKYFAKNIYSEKTVLQTAK